MTDRDLAGLLASLPILAVVWLMAVRQVPAAKAGGLGLILAVVLAQVWFEPLSAARVAGVLAEAAFTTLTIVWIIFPALWLYEWQGERGTFAQLRERLSGLTDDPRILVLLVAWFFGLFMEGAAGFGTPVALGAPILVALGFAPPKAVALMLIGHAAGVSFGAVGTPIVPQVALTGVSAPELAWATAWLHVCTAGVLMVALHRLAGGPGSPRASVPAVADGGLVSAAWSIWALACFLIPYGLIAWAVGPELPTLAGALIGASAFLLSWRWWGPGRPGGPGGSRGPATRPLMGALWPYAILLILVALTRLWSEAQELLQALDWQWELLVDGQGAAFGGRVAPLYHPGTLLAASLLGAALLARESPLTLVPAARRAARRLPAVVLALLVMLLLARVMVHCGMVGVLADSAASVARALWPAFAPAAGVLGTFVTGSATASNILLTDFQARAAATLGLALVPVLAAQGFGAAVGNIICPHNLVAGCATVGALGREGEILRRTLPACVVYALAGGLLALWLAQGALR